MRINDIIVEQGLISQIKKDYQRGYDAVDRVMNPAKWGTGSGKDSTVKDLDVRDSLKTAVNGGRIYEQDRKILLSLAQQVQSGKVQTKQDPQQVQAVLKMAANNRPLNDQQRSVLAVFSKEV